MAFAHISVEAQIPRDNVYTGAEWAKISVERIHRFLGGYPNCCLAAA